MRVATLTTLVAGARAMSLKAGAQVPKFAVTAHTGAAVSSDSLAGSAYCLWFYPKADTGGATTAWTRGAFKLTTMHCGDGVLGSSTLDDDATPSPRHSPSAAGVETATVARRRGTSWARSSRRRSRRSC